MEIILAWFQCSRAGCKKTFLAYVKGSWVPTEQGEERKFWSENYGIIDANSYIKPLKDKRLCTLHWKNESLTDYMEGSNIAE